MASALPPILVEIQADVASLKKGLADAQNALKGINDTVDKTGSTMTKFMDKVKQTGAALGIAFAGSQIISFFRESIAAANEASNAQERLATLLRNTNGGTEEQIQALYDQAEALEAVGVVSKDNIIVAQSQLATFDLTAKTINTLTPAILDYVTAEKGAAASADDYKQMTNSLAQALNGNFASLTRVGFVLDETTRKQISSGTESERAAAIVEVLNSTYKGFNETLRDQNPLQAAINDLNKLKGDIGEALLPIIDQLSRFISNTLIPGLRSLAKFVKDNSTAIKTFAGVIAIAYAGMKIYRGILIATATAKKAYQVATLLMKGGQLASIASTNGLAASMLRLNAIMKANLFGIIVTAVAALAAGLVWAWKNSETFRNIVIKLGKAALTAFAAIIPIVAKVYEAIAKIVTGPLRLFLGVLSKLPGVGKYAKSGLDMINKGLDGISDLGVKAAAKANELIGKLDKMGESAKKAGKKVKEATDPFSKTTKGPKTLTDEEKNKLKDYQEKVKDIYQSMNDVIEDAHERAQDALETRNERMAEAHERYNERVADLNERYNEQIAAAQERFNEREVDLKERYLEQIETAVERQKEAEAKATKRYGEEVIKINKDFDKRRVEFEKARDEKIKDLMESAVEKRADITKKGQDRLAQIVESSRDRLRDAFAKATEFNLEDMFAKGRGRRRNIVDVMKVELASMKSLQNAAGELAGAGYSQTFIEQIVKAGPKAGLRMVAQIKKLSPEQQGALKETYGQLEELNKTGMDSIAKSLSDNSRLATKELREMYDQTAADISESLAQVDMELKSNLAQAQANYSEALAEATAARNESLTEAYNDMREAIAESERELAEARVKAKAALDKGMAEAQAELEKSRKKAQEELSKGLLEAQEQLQKALIEAQKDYEKAIDKINESTQKKLEKLKRDLAEVAALMAQLSAAQAAAAIANAPVYTPIVAVGSGGGSSSSSSGTSSSTTVNVTGVNLTNPTQTASSVINAIKFGNVVVPTQPTALAAKESGAIGAASIAARTKTITSIPASLRSRGID